MITFSGLPDFRFWKDYRCRRHLLSYSVEGDRRLAAYLRGLPTDRTTHVNKHDKPIEETPHKKQLKRHVKRKVRGWKRKGSTANRDPTLQPQTKLRGEKGGNAGQAKQAKGNPPKKKRTGDHRTTQIKSQEGLPPLASNLGDGPPR